MWISKEKWTHLTGLVDKLEVMIIDQNQTIRKLRSDLEERTEIQFPSKPKLHLGPDYLPRFTFQDVPPLTMSKIIPMILDKLGVTIQFVKGEKDKFVLTSVSIPKKGKT